MRFRLPAAIIVFLGSYLPLSVILLVQDLNFQLLKNSFCNPFGSERSACQLPLRNPDLSLVAFFVCLGCFLITLLVLALTKTNRPIVIKEARYTPADLMNYTLPYIVSFMNLDYQETGKFIGLVVFLGWMFWITYKSGQLMLNPILIAFGWRLYEIRYTHPGSEREYASVALADNSIEPGECHKHSFIQDIVIVRVAPEAKR